MNRVVFPFLKSLVVLLLTMSAIANAAEQNKTGAVKKADPAAGEALFANGDTVRNVPACVTCHGTAGNSSLTLNPKLAAQHQAYVVKQLVNFKSSERNNPIMGTFAKALTEGDMKDIAAYLEAQVQTPGAAKSPQAVALGKKIYRAGIAEKNVPACAGCHSPTGAGIPAQFPRLSGQHQEYTVSQLVAFRAGTRTNSVQMMAIAKRMSDDEIQAIADYVAGLR